MKKMFNIMLCFVFAAWVAIITPISAIAAEEPELPGEKATGLPAAVEKDDTVTESRSDQAKGGGETKESTQGFWRNVVPVPIFLTEPAVGKGLGVAIGYFHPTRADGGEADAPFAINGTSVDDTLADRKAPPTITGVAAGYTNNHTKFLGIGHSRTFKKDHVRMNVAAGWADVFADIYVLGIPFEFNLEGYIFYADTRVRFGDSDFFWGVGASALKADNTFLLPLPDRPPLGLLDFDFLDIGMTGRIMYDSRNDPMFPSSGQRVDLTVAAHNSAIGGDYDYVLSKIKALTYHPLGTKMVISGRLEAQVVSGDPPFFAVPYVALRGIPALRYQGDRVAVAEAEFRYRIATRWTALAFGGLGWRDSGPLKRDDSIYNFGIGGRFKVMKNREVWVGLDIARGPESTYWYIQVGQAW